MWNLIVYGVPAVIVAPSVGDVIVIVGPGGGVGDPTVKLTDALA